MPILFIPVAIPGAGKTSMASYLGEVNRVSTDDIREWIAKDVDDQSRNGDVFKHFHEQIEYMLRGNKCVYADATNLTGRADLRKIVDKVNADYRSKVNPYGLLQPVTTHLILFRNLGQAIARNSARERTVPPDVMLRMIEKYERAVIDIAGEHYDYVTEVSAVR